MKKITLIRHAKAEVLDYDNTDFERNLRSRGVDDSNIIAKVLTDNGFKPELIISSDANRAIQTAEVFAEVNSISTKQIVKLRSIYDNLNIQVLSQILDQYASKNEMIYLIGHNPDISYLAYKLCDEFSMSVPTCAAIGLEFDIENWSEISPGTASLLFYEYPKKYK
ncbi:MAG: histidine phosphatase family protein [Marinifilaceae bacterium]|jgi:phosphohistidine phosphatase|nr:histidine phosphatase family protein [Marinifilaceae bacterium]